jgi:tetratricopeptide (TPR) repeat protein
VRKALQISESLLSTPIDASTQDRAADPYYALGWVLKQTGDLPGALRSFQRAVAIRTSAQSLKGAQSVSLRSHLARDYSAMAMVLASQGQLGSAIDELHRATKLLEDLAAENPTNAAIRGFLADSYLFLGGDLKDSDDLPHGLEYLRKARTIYQTLSQADPQDAWLPYRLGYADQGISELLFKKGNAKEAFETLRCHGGRGNKLTAIDFLHGDLRMKGFYHMLPSSCTDTAFPSNSTVVSNFSGAAMPTPFDSLARTIRNVLCSNIPGKLPRRSPTVKVEALSSQCRGMTEYAPCS